MSKLFSRATVTGATLSGANLKSALTALWDALNSVGVTDASRTTVTSTATLVSTQCGLVLVDATSGAIVLTLPTSGAATDELTYKLRRIDTSANTVTVQRGGTDTIDGATSITIPSGAIVELQMPAGSTQWRVVDTAPAAPSSQAFSAFTSAGTAPAYTLTPAPALTALTANQRFRVKIHSATSGACTLAVSGLAATSIKQYDSTGAKVDPVLAANQLVDVEYDGTNWVILDPLPTAVKQLQPITASVGASALTVTLNPTTLDFRSSTLGSGTVVTRTVSAAISLVVSNGSTLGTVNAVKSRIAVLAIDNAGTVELAVCNIGYNSQLDETLLISTTAEGGAGAADSANAIYSTTARTNVAFRIVGYVESTQATAGTWATSPSTIQGFGGNAAAAHGSVGYNQAWTNVTRNQATTYYNDTGRPIIVNVHANNVTTSYAYLVATVGGVTINGTGQATSAFFSLQFMVPPGQSYSWDVSSGTVNTITVRELR